jgi:hypothetical protein
MVESGLKFFLSVVFLISCVPQIGAAAIRAPASEPQPILKALASEPKSFAVFVVSYIADGPQAAVAVGGVAGTAFFADADRAITAYHVLQPKSFQPQPGFTKAKVWLVHERHEAIEIEPHELEYQPDRDLSVIRLKGSKRVSRHFVFAASDSSQSSLVPASSLETEGFVAGTAGPVLEFKNGELEISHVPVLSRVRLSGQVLQQARVNLKSTDVNLNEAPCLKVSYRPVVGTSGGPVTANGRVVGMNSFADPGTREHTWILDLR